MEACECVLFWAKDGHISAVSCGSAECYHLLLEDQKWHREIKELAQSHTASKQQSQDSGLGGLAPGAVSAPTWYASQQAETQVVFQIPEITSVFARNKTQSIDQVGDCRDPGGLGVATAQLPRA